MSAVVFAREGYVAMLAATINGLVATARLFVNDVTPTADTRRIDFVEPEYSGYTSLSVARWTPPLLREGIAFSVCDPLIWQYTEGPAPAPIRGVWVTAGDDGPLIWAWRRPGDPYELGPFNPLLIVYGRLTFPFTSP